MLARWGLQARQRVSILPALPCPAVLPPGDAGCQAKLAHLAFEVPAMAITNRHLARVKPP